MLSSFKFLTVCSVCVEIFSSGENLFVISKCVVFSSRFVRGAERGGVKHLRWSPDVIESFEDVFIVFHVQFVFWERCHCSTTLENEIMNLKVNDYISEKGH